MRAIIDRFEGEYAILETDAGFEQVALAALPDGAKEGDFIVFENGSYRIDNHATQKQRVRTRELLDTIFQKNRPGK